MKYLLSIHFVKNKLVTFNYILCSNQNNYLFPVLSFGVCVHVKQKSEYGGWFDALPSARSFAKLSSRCDLHRLQMGNPAHPQ